MYTAYIITFMQRFPKNKDFFNPTRDPPTDYDELYMLAMKGSDALTATHGKVYDVSIEICV